MKLTQAMLFLALVSSASLAEEPVRTELPNKEKNIVQLAETPPMGWSSWNYYGDRINEKIIIDTIDKMVSLGLRDAGYTYVNIDDGWQKYKGSRVEHPLQVDEKNSPTALNILPIMLIKKE